MAVAAAIGVCLGVGSAEPQFYLIERFGKAGVLIHFDVEPFLTYDLQCTTNLSAATGAPGAPTNAWRSIYVVPATPFFQHFILPEYFTNTTTHQFYRLVATR